MGDINISFLIFLVSLILFHCLIYLKWKNKRFWTQIDYLWVSLSFLGVIGINRDIRAEFNERTISDSKRMLNWNYEEALSNSELYQHFYDPKTTNFRYDLFDDQKEAAAFIEAASWYGKMTDTLKKYKEEILEKDNYIYIKSIKKCSDDFPFSKAQFPELYDLKETIGSYINDVSKNAAIINNILIEEKNREWELVLKFLSPWFLAIAIALRISKVTAQLKGIA